MDDKQNRSRIRQNAGPADPNTVDPPLSAPQALRLHKVCERFEAAWEAVAQNGQPPRIEDYADNVPDPEQPNLIRELVLLDIDYRRLRGENLSLNDYQGRFPGLFRPLAAEGARAAEGDNAAPAQGETTVNYFPVAPLFRSNRYRVRKFHAKGGLGEVWQAHDAEMGRMVAVKRMRENREETRDRFYAEAQITGQLEHPGIVPMHDLGVDEEGRPFYVMTFIRGATLKQAIEEYHAANPARSEPVEVQRCRLLEIFVKICQTVAYAHSKGVLHRDIKPDNVMLGAYGETVVLDWGLAKLRGQPEEPGSCLPVHISYGRDSAGTSPGAVMGTPPYMAPEMAEGQGVAADERTDLYLLGGTLYAILTGRPPRQGSSVQEIVELARTVPPPPPRKVKSNIPRALEAICQKAMAQRKEDRYASALDLAADVQRFLAGAPVAAYPEPLHARVWRWCKRHRRGLVRSAGVVALVALVALGTFQIRKAQAEAEEHRLSLLAHKKLAEFRVLADDSQFHTGLTMPSGEQYRNYDPEKGDAAARGALELGAELEPKLKALLPQDEQEEFTQEFHDLLFLRVQVQVQKSPQQAAVRGLPELLERAAALRGPSRANYLLRAQCFVLQGESEQAAVEKKRGLALKETALDHFLKGEQLRVGAFSQTGVRSDGKVWKPDPHKLAEALDQYQKALQLNRKHFWSYFQLGRCYLSQGLGREALEALGTCVALRPKQPWGYSARGLALALTGGMKDARVELNEALKLDDKFSPALLNRGILSWQEKKYNDALADFGKVLDLPPGKRLLEAAYYRGQMYLARREPGDLQKALADFERVVKENPDFRPVYLSLAQAHFLDENKEQCLASLKTFLDKARPTAHDPKDPELFAQRGRMLRWLVPTRVGLEFAGRELEKAVALGGKSAELFYDLAWVLERRRDLRGALQNYSNSRR